MVTFHEAWRRYQNTFHFGELNHAYFARHFNSKHDKVFCVCAPDAIHLGHGLLDDLYGWRVCLVCLGMAVGDTGTVNAINAERCFHPVSQRAKCIDYRLCLCGVSFPMPLLLWSRLLEIEHNLHELQNFLCRRHLHAAPNKLLWFLFARLASSFGRKDGSIRLRRCRTWNPCLACLPWSPS